MPNLPISGLPQATTLDGTELFAVVQGGITKYVTAQNLNYITSNNYGLFNQTGASIPITNTTSELTLLDGGVGTLTVPANGFSVGDAFHAVATGHLDAINNNNLRIRIKSGAVILVDTGNITMAGATNRHWKLEIYFSINAIGGAGVANVSTAGTFLYTKDAGSEFQGVNFSTENNTTFNTLISNILDVTAQWDSADTGNSIYSQIFTLNKTY